MCVRACKRVYGVLCFVTVRSWVHYCISDTSMNQFKIENNKKKSHRKNQQDGTVQQCNLLFQCLTYVFGCWPLRPQRPATKNVCKWVKVYLRFI